MGNVLIKATGIWLLIVVAAILNGTFREKVLVSAIGENMALPLSGLSLAILVFIVSLIFVPFIRGVEPKIFIIIGLFWVVLTLTFEFVFGHFIAGKPWLEIVQVFNVRKGDLFIVVLCVTAISPYFAAKLRGLF
jgi:hypothetical protein